MEWKPIETAPKYPLDGSGHGPRILACGMAVEGHPRMMWDDAHPRVQSHDVIYWVECEYESDEPAGEVDGVPVFRKIKNKGFEYWGPNPQQFRPTHWMPLPAPPER